MRRTSDIKLDAGEPGSPSVGCGLGSFAWQAFFFLNTNTVVPVGQISSRLLPRSEGLPLLKSQKCFFTAKKTPAILLWFCIAHNAHGPWPLAQFANRALVRAVERNE